MGTTLAEKVWADHLVRKGSDGAPDLLYIDLMLMHESPARRRLRACAWPAASRVTWISSLPPRITTRRPLISIARTG